jgi:hypothetical protein
MMLEMRDRLRVVGSRKAADAIGVDALAFIAEDAKLFQRFLDMSGLEVDQIRAEAAKPAFFVGLLDFILAHEPTTMDFAAHAGLDPAEVQIARDALAPAQHTS